LAWRDVHLKAQQIRRHSEAERRPHPTHHSSSYRSQLLDASPVPQGASCESLLSSIGMSLASNSWALMTAREVYWTLRAIPGRTVLDELEQHEQAVLTEWQERHTAMPSLFPPAPQPLSLFTPIDLARRCDQAGIQPNLCVCNREN